MCGVNLHIGYTQNVNWVSYSGLEKCATQSVVWDK